LADYNQQELLRLTQYELLDLALNSILSGESFQDYQFPTMNFFMLLLLAPLAKIIDDMKHELYN
jgi:hypothetical protein